MGWWQLGEADCSVKSVCGGVECFECCGYYGAGSFPEFCWRCGARYWAYSWQQLQAVCVGTTVVGELVSGVYKASCGVNGDDC